MLEAIKNIDPSKIHDIQGFRAALALLINAMEQLLEENIKLKEANQRLLDENNRLKGGNARPKIKSSSKNDISSKGREQGRATVHQHEAAHQPPPPIEI